MKRSRLSPEIATQHKLKEAYRTRGRVLWHGSQGIHRVNRGLKGKAAIKAAKKLTHTKRHYYNMRKIMAGNPPKVKVSKDIE